jgi:hypothetical protein
MEGEGGEESAPFMTNSGEERHSPAAPSARHGTARHGTARHGTATRQAGKVPDYGVAGTTGLTRR